jgi:phosphopantothenoylcysteine decarboxylase
MKILLGITGSVAATQSQKLLEKLEEKGHEIRTVTTQHAKHFHSAVQENNLMPLPGLRSRSKPLNSHQNFTDEDEWVNYKKGDSVLHIELRKWADVLLIAPLSANTLAKLANGISDNLLTSIYRAWDFQHQIILAPAMNTHMWTHPVTNEHLEKLKKWHGKKLKIVLPINKVLACGDEGIGAMANIEDIMRAL